MLKSLGALRPCRNWKAFGTLCRHDLRYQQQGCGDATSVSDIGLHSADVIMTTKRKRDGLIRAEGRRVRRRLKRRGLMSVCGESVETSQGHTIGSSRALMIL